MILKSNQLFNFKFTAGRIPSQAFRDLYNRYADTNNLAVARMLNGAIGGWADDSNPWNQWTTEKYVWDGVEYSGNWTTRFSKLWRNRTGDKISETLLQELGSFLGQFQKEKDYYFQITRIFHWNPGDFGERDGKSCWWQSNYGHSRIGLAARDYGYAALFYESQEQFSRYEGKRGVARAWVVNREDKAFIFNAYGVPLSKMATAIAEVNGLETEKVKIYSPDVYINAGNLNNEGLDGGSSGLGYLLAPKVDEVKTGSPSEIHYLPSFGTEDAHCHHCKEAKKPKHLTLRGLEVYCDNCMAELFPRCVFCEKESPGRKAFRSNVRKTVHVCFECIKSRDLDNEQHTCSVHGMCLDFSIKVWHTNIRACSACQISLNIRQCDICGRVERDTIPIEYNGRLLTVSKAICKSCRRKIAKSILREETSP